mgnify:CR=1 FL=1
MKWWGYIHENGSLQIKRFLDDRDLEDACESPFVKRILPIVDVPSREEAEKVLVAYMAKDALKKL